MSIDPGVGDSSLGLILGQAEKPRYDGGGGHFDIDNMVKTDFIVRVPDLEDALDFISLYHCLEDSGHGDRLLSRPIKDI